MASDSELSVLDGALDAWRRSNLALQNLLRALPPGALQARALPGSPSIGQMCTHIYHERMVSVLENAPEAAGLMPDSEWADEHDLDRIVHLLTESADHVAEAVRRRIGAGLSLDKDFAHPVQLLLFLVFHDGYHHGQMKLAAKAAGFSVADDVVGEQVWDVWRQRAAPPTSESTSSPADLAPSTPARSDP